MSYPNPHCAPDAEAQIARYRRLIEHDFDEGLEEGIDSAAKRLYFFANISPEEAKVELATLLDDDEKPELMECSKCGRSFPIDLIDFKDETGDGEFDVPACRDCYGPGWAPALAAYLNRYKCPYDGATWVDLWDSECNDRCPTCNKEIEPYESEEV